MEKVLLKLFVTGQTIRSGRAIANLRRIFEVVLKMEYELTVVDVMVRPQQAEDEKILVTPTLIKESPPPVKRIIGDLTDTEQVLLGLDLGSQRPEREEP